MIKKDLKTLKRNLPKVPGILGKEKYFNSAVLIPLIFIDGEYYLLFEKRAANIRQGGEISFPGGEFDAAEDRSFKETAIREAAEELGIDKSNIRIHGQLDTLIGPTGVTIDSFIATLNIQNIGGLNFDKTEVEKIFIVPVSFFENNQPETYHIRLEFHSSYFDKEGNKIDLLPVKELQLPERYSNPWGGRKQHIYVYKTAEGVIWGLTAVLINEIVKKLKE